MFSESRQFVLPHLVLGGRGMSGTWWQKPVTHFSLPLSTSNRWLCKPALSMHGTLSPSSFNIPLTGLPLSPSSCSWETRAEWGPGSPLSLSLSPPCTQFMSLPGLTVKMWSAQPFYLPPAQFLPPVARGDRANCHHLHQRTRRENQGPGIVPVHCFFLCSCLANIEFSSVRFFCF